MDDSQWTPPAHVLPRVVCAARLYPSGALCIGPRHGSELMRKQADALCDPSDKHFQVDGFIDQWCRFMTRTEAWKVAVIAGQIRRHCGGDGTDGGTLYSENLY